VEDKMQLVLQVGLMVPHQEETMMIHQVEGEEDLEVMEEVEVDLEKMEEVEELEEE